MVFPPGVELWNSHFLFSRLRNENPFRETGQRTVTPDQTKLSKAKKLLIANVAATLSANMIFAPK
jgi:hypothetical protein